MTTTSQRERQAQSSRPAAAALSSGSVATVPGNRLGFVRSHSWVVELSGLIVLMIAYNYVRALPSTTASVAFAHARHLLSFEGPLFDALELPLNQWIVTVPSIAIAACYIYAVLHYAATPIILLMSRRGGGWQYWRGYWALILASSMAVVVYALYPVAPPRLLPDIDIVDVMRSFSYAGWWGSAASAPHGFGDATNQFAAMPSMHFGWALWCSIQMWGFGRLIWRLLAVTYPLVLAVVVLATGNHFLVDILAGAACVAVAYGVVQLIGTRTRWAASLSSPPEPATARVEIPDDAATADR